MSASSIPQVKAAVRATDLRRAEAAAREALSLSSAREVRGLLHGVGQAPVATMPQQQGREPNI